MKIPTPQLPTEEQMIRTSVKWWSDQKGITFHDWNDTLNNNSYPYELIKFDKTAIQDIINLYDGKGSIDTVKKHFETLLADKIDKFGNGFFLKLNSRSPKDFLFDVENCGKPKPLYTVDDATDAIVSSMRCFEDLCYFKYIDECYLVLRPYIDFHPKREFRVMVFGRQIVGISQYYYDHDFYYTERNVLDIEYEIKAFMKNIVIPNMNINHFVADVIISGGIDVGNTKLLETNPFGLSDPCLFKTYSALDGTIKTFTHE